ncbi:hypothetical protein [Pseudomonas vanderleydeniana]|uniref:Uncharacterized protein n=1 Tax=Pseudomonas vanderleydeniana TaxID=2745495 RepID=A0A9E6TQI9_9PSED|nr:hypothetical protein [Pseudomonas vanderleydeniana]QXI26010.1 hypothetical protein HU752_018795 [Pseudomonas vanderleydeniana]
MTPLRSLVRKAAILSAIALLSLATACSKSPDAPKTGTTEQADASRTAPSKLGDLSAFQSIASQVSGLVDQNDLAGAKARIKDLEMAWDSAEAGIKPRAASDWHLLDKAIDNALEALRASSPKQADCKAAMADLLKAFATLQGTQ